MIIIITNNHNITIIRDCKIVAGRSSTANISSIKIRNDMQFARRHIGYAHRLTCIFIK